MDQNHAGWGMCLSLNSVHSLSKYQIAAISLKSMNRMHQDSISFNSMDFLDNAACNDGKQCLFKLTGFIWKDIEVMMSTLKDANYWNLSILCICLVVLDEGLQYTIRGWQSHFAVKINIMLSLVSFIKFKSLLIQKKILKFQKQPRKKRQIYHS